MKITEKKKLLFVYLGIFVVIFMLNCLTHRGIGDDYVYSFVWEGHSMYEPISESARRISSFSDIGESLYCHYMTWSGRIIAHGLAMFFLWMPRIVFNLVIALITVILVLCIQWISRGGQLVKKLSAKEAALIFFCLWSFHANFVGVFIWTDGSCNYLFPMVFLLLFLLPYIRHYMSDGEKLEKPWLTAIMFPLGILAGNSNENTICWIGLFGFFYLINSYNNGQGKSWMLMGFLGLSIGYGLLMLAPGNLLRIVDSHEELKNFMYSGRKMLTIWFSMVLQSTLWFYLWRVLKRRRIFLNDPIKRKYYKLAMWLAVNSCLFNLIMLFAPEFPNRSLFPGLIFCISATFVAIRLAFESHVHLIAKGTSRFCYFLAFIYFAINLSFTTWWYVERYGYEEEIEREAQLLSNKNQILIITKKPPYESPTWNLISGFHLSWYSLSSDENRWDNVAFARFYHLKGVVLEKEKK